MHTLNTYKSIVYSSLIVRGHILGFSTIVKTRFRLASELECLVTYHWNDKSTTRDCKNKGKASIVMGK